MCNECPTLLVKYGTDSNVTLYDGFTEQCVNLMKLECNINADNYIHCDELCDYSQISSYEGSCMSSIQEMLSTCIMEGNYFFKSL